MPGNRWTLALVGLLLFAACCLLLAACTLPPIQPRATPTAAETEAEQLPLPTVDIIATPTLTPGVTSIVFWEPYPLDRPEGGLILEMVRDFEAANPDTKVDVVAKSGVLGVHEAILAQAQEGGEPPDLAVAFPSSIADLASAGLVAPLDAYVHNQEVGLSDGDLADIYSSTLEAGRIPGFGRQLLAFPFVQNAVGMWVNDSLLDQAGWKQPPATWAEFEQACLDVLAYTGARCLPFVESVSVFNAWLYSRGGQQLTDDGTQAAFNGPAGVESLTLLRRLIDTGVAWRPEQEYGDYLAFAGGQSAFAFSSTGNNRLYAEAYNQAVQNGMPPFRWRQTMLPQADPAQPATVLYGTDLFVLNGDPLRQEAAWRLIRWLTSTEQTARWASGIGTLPIRASALAIMTDTLASYPFMRDQVQAILPYARPEPAVAAELQVREILYSTILSVTLGYADPQSALDRAALEVNAVLAK
jgi:ABC-type glycerol-3-phosphate transport system substrate-binding protein